MQLISGCANGEDRGDLDAARASCGVAWEKAAPKINARINAEGRHDWPFDPEFPLATPHLLFGSEEVIRMNRHDYYELLIALDAGMVFQVQNRFVPLEPGDLLVMGSSLYHRPLRCEEKAVPAHVLFFMPDVLTSARFGAEGPLYQPFLRQDGSFPHVVPAATGIPDQVLAYVGEIEREQARGGVHSRLYAVTCLRMILAILLMHYSKLMDRPLPENASQRDFSRLQPLFEFMERHPDQRICLSKAASLTGMSRTHFTRFFKRMTAHSFGDYQQRFRINRAQELLKETDAPISEIAWAVGFYDQSHFTGVFRRLTKMTPHQYRTQTLLPRPYTLPRS